jgi:septal ring factor EnvC (AmiA/AmiB activator)
MGAIMFGMGAVGYLYYNDTQQRLAQLRENNARLEIAAQTSQDTITKLQQDAAQFEAANNQLRNELNEAEAYSDDLQAKLRNHNLTVLTAQKPGLIETRVNAATARLFDEMEALTGALRDDIESLNIPDTSN